MKSSVILSLVAYAEANSNLRIATLSDLHLFEGYEPRYDSSHGCWPDSGATLLDQPAYFGQFGCDPPELLVRRMFERLNFEN
jgi:hypothetical protein